MVSSTVKHRHLLPGWFAAINYARMATGYKGVWE
jgi:hypothetical protein